MAARDDSNARCSARQDNAINLRIRCPRCRDGCHDVDAKSSRCSGCRAKSSSSSARPTAISVPGRRAIAVTVALLKLRFAFCTLRPATYLQRLILVAINAPQRRPAVPGLQISDPRCHVAATRAVAYSFGLPAVCGEPGDGVPPFRSRRTRPSNAP